MKEHLERFCVDFVPMLTPPQVQLLERAAGRLAEKLQAPEHERGQERTALLELLDMYTTASFAGLGRKTGNCRHAVLQRQVLPIIVVDSRIVVLRCHIPSGVVTRSLRLATSTITVFIPPYPGK